MLRAIYPGSFDPVTYGHLDIIRRSCKIVDELVVGVLNNNAKMPLFSVEERVKMLEEATKDLTNVRIVPFHGLLIDFARQMDFGQLQILNMNCRCRRRTINWSRIWRRCF